MNISIENNELIYIRFFKKTGFDIVEEMCISVNCFLLFDKLNNWVGLEILSEDFEGPINLPPIKTNDFPMYNSLINQDSKSIKILFNKDVKVTKKLEQDCNIDTFNGQVYGIEIILWEKNKIGNVDIVKPFVSKYE